MLARKDLAHFWTTGREWQVKEVAKLGPGRWLLLSVAALHVARTASGSAEVTRSKKQFGNMVLEHLKGRQGALKPQSYKGKILHSNYGVNTQIALAWGDRPDPTLEDLCELFGVEAAGR